MKEPLQLGNCYLYHGDSFDILPKLDTVADAVISDLPYGITDCEWDTMPPLGRFWDLVECRSKPTANFVLFGCGKFTIELVNSKYRLRQRIASALRLVKRVPKSRGANG